MAAMRGLRGSIAMYLALGAAAAGVASSAMDLLSSLAPSKSGAGKTTGLTQTSSFDISSASAVSATTTAPSGQGVKSGALSSSTFNALLAAQGSGQSAKSASPSDALKDLFAKLDTDGDGKVSKSEFEDKLGAGGTNVAAADNVFSKLDTDGDGTVSLNELATALLGKAKKPRHAHGAGAQDALLKALEGAQSTSTTKSDGSTSTTLTYANGTTVTLSTPAPSGASASASSSYNLVERMIQKQVDALAASSQQSVSMKV